MLSQWRRVQQGTVRLPHAQCMKRDAKESNRPCSGLSHLHHAGQESLRLPNAPLLMCPVPCPRRRATWHEINFFPPRLEPSHPCCAAEGYVRHGKLSPRENQYDRKSICDAACNGVDPMTDAKIRLDDRSAKIDGSHRMHA